MTETSPANAQPSKTKFVLTLLMHQLIGTLGVVMLATMLTTVAFEIPNPWGHTSARHDVYGVLTGSPFFPVPIMVAFLVGWLLSDLFGHKSMLWIWVLPYGVLVYSFARMNTVAGLPLQERISYFFGWGCRPENHCIDQVGITLPFYAAAAYSIGALLAVRFPMRSLVARKRVSALVFLVGILLLGDEVNGLLFHFRSSLALVPRGWEWVVLPASALDAAIGVCFIYFALKMRRGSQDAFEGSGAT